MRSLANTASQRTLERLMGSVNFTDVIHNNSMRLHKLLILILVVAQWLGFNVVYAQPFPEAVVRLAQAYAKKHPNEVMRHNSTVLEEYAVGYFDGFRNTGVYPEDSGIRKESYAKGRARWHRGPEARKRTFAEYGYEFVDLTGVWSIGHERSEFAGYYLQYLPVYKTNLPKNQRHPYGDSFRVRVIGYLSPEGRYGHFGMHSRTLLAQSVKFLEVYPLARPVGLRGEKH